MKQHLLTAVSLELDDRFANIVSGGFDAATVRLEGCRDVVRREGGRSLHLPSARTALMGSSPVQMNEWSRVGECGEIVEPLPTQTPEQSIWS